MDEARVLIASRNRKARRIIRQVRSSFSFLVQLARDDDDLEDALQRWAAGSGIREKSFQAVVIDFALSNALDAARRVRALAASTVLICVCDEEPAGARIECAQIDASAILFHPLWPEELLLPQRDGFGCLLQSLVESHLSIYGVKS